MGLSALKTNEKELMHGLGSDGFVRIAYGAIQEHEQKTRTMTSALRLEDAIKKKNRTGRR
jgi:hypothetical protein